MRTKTFKRGVHPRDSKNTGKNGIIIINPVKGEELIYPLVQHIGTACVPCVTEGERVLVGQKIADAAGNVSSPIHASVSGVVKEFRDCLTAAGGYTKSIVIENDAEMEEHPDVNHSPVKLDGMSREQILGIIRDSGIVGLGGAGFPTHVKLNPPTGKKIDYIIMNASECEPFLTTDHRVLLEEGARLLRGMRTILHMFPTAVGLIGIETNKADAITLLNSLITPADKITVVPLKPKYPQGSEKHLIYACTGRVVKIGSLPADAGCIVCNVDTVMAIDRAVHRGRPLMRRIVTLDGGAVKNPGNYKVRLGMTFKSLIEGTGGLCAEPAKIVAGGPMMGPALFDTNVPIVKTTSALLCFTAEEIEQPSESACIRCGRCVTHCPMGLMPLELNRASIFADDETFLKINGRDCVECGACSYICPAKRHLAHSIKTAKRRIAMTKK